MDTTRAPLAETPSSWLFDAKLRPPVLHPDRVRRKWPNLGDPLPPLVGLEGGPGAGKTLALAELFQGLPQAGVSTLWYGLDEEDADPATFFLHLVAGMRRHVPVMGEAVLAMVRDGRIAPRPLWQAFFGDMAAYGVSALILALDDVHHLEGTPDVMGALAELAERFPPGYCVLATSRRPLPIGRQLASGRAARLDEAALRFRPDEVQSFLESRARGRPVPLAWRDRAPGLEGWPLGLALVTSGGTDPGETAAAGEAALEAYVADVLYRGQPAERRGLMLRAALLPSVDAETCAAVLGEPRAGVLLAALHADHMLRRLDGGARYVFPAHLRTYLRAEGLRALSPAELTALHRRIAAHLTGQGRLAEALPHLVAAGEWSGAIAASQEAFAAMRHDGRHAEIARHLAAFPQAVREAEPVLALWEAHLHARAGRLAEAASAYERARAGFAEQGDAAGELAALVRLTAASAAAGDLPRFNRLAVQAAARAPEARPEDLAELHLARALVADRRGDAALARECNQAVLALPLDTSVDVAAAHVAARLNLAAAALDAGDVDAAMREAGHARETAAMRGLTSLAIQACFVEARGLLTRGEPGAAARAIAGVPSEWPELLDWQAGAQAHIVAGLLGIAEEAWDEAEAAIRAATSRFEAAGSPEGRKIALEALCWLALRRRQYARVEALVADAGRSPDAGVWNAYDLALALPQARAAHLAGDPLAAIALLEAARPGFAQQGMQLALARAGLYEAAARLETGDVAGARAALDTSEATRQAGGFDFLPAMDPSLWRSLAPLRAQPSGPVAPPDAAAPLDPPATRAGTGVLPAAGRPAGRSTVVPAAPGTAVPKAPGTAAPTSPGTVVPTPPGAAAASAPDLKAGTPATPTAAAGAVARASAAGQLEFTCFGRFEVRLDGQPLDRWPRRKAKVTLAALALRGRAVASYELGELLGDGDAVSGHGILKVTMPALRRALQPDLVQGAASAFIRTLEDGYALVDGVVARSDVRVFEQAIARGQSRRVQAPLEAAAAYEEALATYRGDLLDETLFAAAFEAERETFRRQALDAAFWLADQRGALGDGTGRSEWLTRAGQISPSDEEVYIRLMRHHREAGRPDRVRQAYWDCRKALKRQLDVEPSEAFEAAYRELA